MPRGFFDDDDDDNTSQTGSPTAGGAGGGRDESFFDDPTRRGARQGSTSSARFNINDISTDTDFRDSSIFDQPNDSRARRGDTTELTLDEILNGKAVREVVNKREGESNVQALIRCLRNERAAPELLLWPKSLLENISADLVFKKHAISATFKSLDRDAPPPLRRPKYTKAQIHDRVTLTATEVMRADFILKSYLRARLFKISKHVQHILADEDDAELRLSGPELRFARGYLEARNTYMRDAFMGNLPEKVQRIDETIVPTPDFHQPVLVRAAKDCGPITLPDGMKMELAAGSQHMVRYNSIRELLLRESVDLI